MTNTVEYLPNRYTANGVTTTFSFDFKIIEDTDVEVFIEASGVQTKLTNGTDYTVSFTVGSSGGSIITDDVYDDCDIIIARKRPVKQTTSFTTADGFQADVIETNIADDLNIQIQQVAYDALRSIKLPVGSDTDINLPYPIEGKSIIGTSDGGYTNSTISVDEIQTYVDEANAAADLAQAAVGSIPTPVALNYLRQKSDISGFEYITPEQVAGDIQEHIKMIPEIGTCSTASATAEKAVVCEGFELVDGVTIMTTFDNSNTASGDYLQVSFNGNANDDFGLYTPTVIGSPTFTNNKFNSNGNTGLSYLISTLGSGTWCIQGKFKSTNTTTAQQIFDTSSQYGMVLQKNTSNKLIIWLSTTGASPDIASSVLGSKNDWSTSTEYYIRFRFTGTQYLVDWSTDGTNWTNDITVNSTSLVVANTITAKFGVGYNGSEAPLIGTMDDLRVSVGSATITDTRLKINANSTGAVSLVGIDGKKTSYLPANTKIPLFYDGTNFVSLLTNTGAVMPNYASEISKAWNTNYTAESDGWLRCINGTVAGVSTKLVVNTRFILVAGPSTSATVIVPVSKGDTYINTFNEGSTTPSIDFKFYPAKGA